MAFKNYIKGLKLGMILQFAIGPVCLMVFNTSKESGFIASLAFIMAAVLVDSFYILISIICNTKILNNREVKYNINIIGSIVLIIFGINIILNVFDINIIPFIKINYNSYNLFLEGLILTLSNPLTIIFWGSILNVNIEEYSLENKDIIVFSLGLVSATLFFLIFISLIGLFLSTFISNTISDILNIIVGIIIIYFGLKRFIKK